MTTQVRAWLHGLGAAIVGGSASTTGSVLGAMAAGYDVFDVGFWKVIAGGVVGGALVAAVAYLTRSPLPPLVGNGGGNGNESGSGSKNGKEA
jgi:hypothetical protein